MKATVLDIVLGNLINQRKISIRIRKKTKPRISNFISNTFLVVSSDCGKQSVTDYVCVKISHLIWTKKNENKHSIKMKQTALYI